MHQIHNLIYFVHDLVAHVDIESVRSKKHAFCLEGPRCCQTAGYFMERALSIFADFEATKLMMAFLQLISNCIVLDAHEQTVLVD